VFEEFTKTNTVVDLDPEFIEAANKATAEWTARQAKRNKWFARVWKHQQEYARNFANAARYR
jgi:TRAP-type mannitol/chloroaromatic compound transport system substrate-binding protein